MDAEAGVERKAQISVMILWLLCSFSLALDSSQRAPPGSLFTGHTASMLIFNTLFGVDGRACTQIEYRASRQAVVATGAVTTRSSIPFLLA